MVQLEASLCWWAVLGFRMWSDGKYQLQAKYSGSAARDQRTCSPKRVSYMLEHLFALLKKHIHVPRPGAALKAETTAEVWFWEVKVQCFSEKCPSASLMTNETVLLALYALDASLSLLLLVLKRGYQKVAQCIFCSWHIDGRSTKVNFLLQK